MKNLSDAYLIAQVIIFDSHKAYGKLVVRYQSDVRGLLTRLTGDKTIADDLAQDTFIKAYKYIKSFKATAKFSTWLYRIAYNIFLTHQKQNNKIRIENLADGVGENWSYEQEHTIADAMDINMLLSYLREEERMALMLVYQKGYTHEQGAVVMECPLGTFKTHVLRGKEKLKKIYKEV